MAFGQAFDQHELQVAAHVSTGDLAGAIFSIPAVGDFDGDENLDLIVATQHYGQAVRFHRGQISQGKRVFDPGVEVTLPIAPMIGIDWNRDAWTDILFIEDKELFVALCKGGNPPVFQSPQTIRNTKNCKALAHAKFLGARSSNGLVDIVIGGFDFRDYWPKANNPRQADIGFWRGYDATGRWRGQERLEFLTGTQHSRTDKPPISPQEVLFNGRTTPLAARLGASPIFMDADGDGRSDLIYSDFVGNFFFAKNPKKTNFFIYEDPVALQLNNGQPLRAPQCVVRGMAVHWNADRWEDLVFGCEDGFVYVCLNDSKGSGKPVFAVPFRVQQKRPSLDFGVAAVPTPCDIDKDGDTDLIVGNASGEILMSKNNGTNEQPAFDLPVRCEVGGKPFRIEAGYGGSIQGPNEARWGYVAVSTSDVDIDGDLDLLISSINGYHHYLLNIGNVKKPIWKTALPILSHGKRFRSVWRTRPLQTDWDGDGWLDYICQNKRGEIGMFRGAKNRPSNHLEGWTGWRFENGAAIDPDGHNGMEGRAKIAIADWDGDGRKDLLVGTKGGTPWSSRQGRKNLSYVFFLKGIQSGRNAIFAEPRAIRFANGMDIEVGDHTASPETATFFGDKKPGLLWGIENGRVHYYSQRELSW